MTTELRFWKLDGAGNDFIGLDWRDDSFPTNESFSSLVRQLCKRHHGIGADGVILIGKGDETADFAMKYYNADGSIGSMCGNGARCACVFAHFLGAAPEAMTFLTDDGLYRADLTKDGARVYFPDVPRLPEKRELGGTALRGQFIDYLYVGVPHAVLFVDDLEAFDVEQTGREIRYDPAFAPAGTNANFAQMKDGVLHLRTYERGVEEETQACGTGSIASVLCYARREGWQGEHQVDVMPTGQMPLVVQFTMTEEGHTGVVLGGPARLVFQGEIPKAWI